MPEAQKTIGYDATMLFWRIITQIFFREIRPRGAFHIPKEGPVIFVGAPHNNQVGNARPYEYSVSESILVSRPPTLEFGSVPRDAPTCSISSGSSEHEPKMDWLLCAVNGQ